MQSPLLLIQEQKKDNTVLRKQYILHLQTHRSKIIFYMLLSYENTFSGKQMYFPFIKSHFEMYKFL